MFLFSCLINVSGTFAQTQADNWYFGNNAGMSFWKGGGYHVAYPVFNGQTTSIEGCASISDTSGNLLFYTDGINVWDNTHSLMPNGTGILGHPSATQTALIVQKPSDPDIYYILTTTYNFSLNGLRWTEVDMTLNAGKGDVTGNKNVLLHAPSTEKLCGVKHCNKKDVWIITHDWNSNQFRSYLITSAGINPVPVLSSSGSVHGGNTLNKTGQMKVSMDGKRIACAVPNSQFLELHDFDNTTGIVSNGFVVNNTPDNFYGVEFSKSARKLYASCLTTGNLYQWDMCAGSNTDIKNSEFLVADSLSNAGALQLGPDGKIYRARNGEPFVDFIEYPEVPGINCKYHYEAVVLWPGMTGSFGLPGFVVDYINPAVKIWFEDASPDPCSVKQFFFTAFNDTNCIGAFNNILSFIWEFGDTASGNLNFSTLPDPIHSFSTTGLFYISLILTYDCVIDTIKMGIVVGCGTGGGGGGGGGGQPVLLNAFACQGSSAILTVPTPTTGTPPHYVAWSPWVGVGFTISAPAGAGGATAIVIDANGYGSIYKFSIIYTSNPSVTAWGTSDCNQSFMNIAVTGGTPPYSPSNFFYPTNPGPYTVIISDANGCTGSAVTTVPDPAYSPTYQINTTNVSCYGGSDGTATITLSGGTPTVSLNWIGGTNNSATGLSAGTYTIWILYGNSIIPWGDCSTSTTFTINEPPPLFNSLLPLTQNPSCPGYSDGYGEVFIGGGTLPYQYLWSSGSIGNSATNLMAGINTVTVTDANGCTLDTTLILIDPPQIILQTNSFPASCPGIADGSAIATPSGGMSPFSFLWSNGAITDVNNNLLPGIYFVTITDSNNCSVTDSVEVMQLTAVIPNIDNYSDATCNGVSDGSAIVSATGGTGPYSYLWSNGNTNNFDNNLSANVYTITITDSNGCNSIISVTIDEPTVYFLSAASIIDVSCFGGNDGSAAVNISAGVQPVFYEWSTGNIGNTHNGLSASTYVITATDALGCSAVTNVTINEPAQLIASFTNSSDISCYGLTDGTITASASGGISPYNFTWSNGANGITVTDLAAGVYDVIITDNNNCTTTATTTITEPDELISAISNATDVNCFGGSDGSATVNVTGGISPYIYLWSSGNTGLTATGIGAGNFVVTITDNNGCMSTTSVQINEPDQLIISLSTTDEICDNSNGTASAVVTGGVNPYTFIWSDGSTSVTAINISSGLYVVTITDANGCTISNSISVINIPGPVLNLSSQLNAMCYGYCDGNIYLNVNSGTSPFNYTWNSLPGNNLPYATGLCAGVYDVTVIDSNNCVNNISVTITEPLQVMTTVSPDTLICIGESVLLFASSAGGTPGYNYSWTPGNFNSQSILVSPFISTNYTVSTLDSIGCIGADQSIIVTVIPNPIVSFIADDTEGCEPLCINFTNLTPDIVTCLWDFSGQTYIAGNNISHCFYKPGLFNVSLSVTDIYGCSNQLLKPDYIKVNPKPTPDFIFNPPYATIFEPYFNFTDLSSADVVEWLWQFGDPHESISLIQHPTFFYRDTGAFIVSLIITNHYGCKDTISKELTVEELFTVFIPNAFTPGEINPLFKPVFALQNLERYKLKIINRWGEIIYQTNNLHEGWDGRKAGKLQPEGVYIYVVEAEHRNEVIKKMGHVTLLR
jgi:gliding motility-associated-like protein